ncbi:protein-tyrosine phosphatase family protein [Angustibacter speluncae]
MPQLGLALGTARDRARWVPGWPVTWVDWPDFGTPRDDDAATAAVVDAHRAAAAGALVEVTCTGGTGRTGTVLACMAVLAGHPADDAVAWTRRHHRPRAVETPGQRRWVLRFAERVERGGLLTPPPG